jgi:hypothetical protein
VFVFATTSCEDWLDVKPENEASQESVFSSVEGFHSALSGVYLGMGDIDLYGMHLTWHMVDYLAHYYASIPGSVDLYLHTHQYDHANVSPYIQNIWDKQYNLIANCNNLLSKLDEYRANVDELNYQLIRGETLTLRAFLHFDLMRLFGKGNLSQRNVGTELTIPYVTEFKKEITPQPTYNEFFTLLEKDLREGIALLYGENGENCYRLTYDDPFFDEANGRDYAYWTYFNYNTSPRIDYLTARAILARVLMWEGKSESYQEVLDIAQEWIDTENDSFPDDWDWVISFYLSYNLYENYILSMENIWHLKVNSLFSYVGDWLDASNPTATYQRIYLSQATAFEIFENNSGNNTATSDYRFVYMLQPQGSGGLNYATLKMEQILDVTTATGNAKPTAGLIPLIGTSELYYYCAEVYMNQGNLGKAIEALNTVRQHRGISADLPNTLTAGEVKAEILKEWRKEFVSLGQLFYFYKRWGVETVVGYSEPMTDLQYVLPIPDDEITYGNRQ